MPSGAHGHTLLPVNMGNNSCNALTTVKYMYYILS